MEIVIFIERNQLTTVTIDESELGWRTVLFEHFGKFYDF
jgi:hypothetical protein